MRGSSRRGGIATEESSTHVCEVSETYLGKVFVGEAHGIVHGIDHGIDNMADFPNGLDRGCIMVVAY